MKSDFLKCILALCIFCLLTNNKLLSQNVQLNIIAQNAGIVKKGEKTFIEVSVCNTGPEDIAVPAFRLRPQVLIATPKIVKITDTGHILPDGWTITYKSDSLIRFSNGTDKLTINSCRKILINVEGMVAGGPAAIYGAMLFANGISPGNIAAGSTANDNPADNSSTTALTIQ